MPPVAGAVSHPERQSGAPSIERVLHHEAWQEGAVVQIPLNFTGAVAKDPVSGRDGGRENKQATSSATRASLDLGFLRAAALDPALRSCLPEVPRERPVVRGDTGAEAELLVPDAAVSARPLFSETLAVFCLRAHQQAAVPPDA